MSRDSDNPSQWTRTDGNEDWEFDDNGLIRVLQICHALECKLYVKEGEAEADEGL
jgi:nuclear transport factor 2 (NTF2) superfamily protein